MSTKTIKSHKQTNTNHRSLTFPEIDIFSNKHRRENNIGHGEGIENYYKLHETLVFIEYLFQGNSFFFVNAKNVPLSFA